MLAIQIFPGDEQLFDPPPGTKKKLVNGVRFGERYRHWEMDALRTLVRDVQVWPSRVFFFRRVQRGVCFSGFLTSSPNKKASGLILR